MSVETEERIARALESIAKSLAEIVPQLRDGVLYHTPYHTLAPAIEPQEDRSLLPGKMTYAKPEDETFWGHLKDARPHLKGDY